MPDLPDYYTQVTGVLIEAEALHGGADASKAADPDVRDIYLATDTDRLWYAVADGAWRSYFMSARLLTENSLLYATADYTPDALSVAASRIVGRKSTGDIAALTGAETLALLSGQAGAAFSMNSQKITTLADPTAAQDAATRNYADTTFLPLAGGTLTGDLSIGANLLKTTNLSIVEVNSILLGVKNAAGDAYRDLKLRIFFPDYAIEAARDGVYISPPNSDNMYLLGKARDNGVGLVEVNRWQGAADPYFSMGGSQEFKFYHSGIADFGSAAITNLNMDSGTIDGATITSPTLQGTVGAGTGLTMPAFTLGGTITLSGQAFDAGSGVLYITNTASGNGLTIENTHDGILGATFRGFHVSASPAADDRVCRLVGSGKNDAAESLEYGMVEIAIQDPTDGSEDGKLQVRLQNDGAYNLAIELTGAGELTVDRGLIQTDGSGSVSGGTDLSGSRAVDTVYQNSTKFRIVSVSFAMDDDGYCLAYTDSSNPPTTIVAAESFSFLTEVYNHVFFFVQPSHYYKVSDVLANATIYKWIEWDLF